MSLNDQNQNQGGLTAEEEKEANEIAERLQRLTRVQNMVKKRKSNFDYIKKIHSEDCFWLNCSLIKQSDLIRLIALEIPRVRFIQYFYLGLSLGRLFECSDGIGIIRAVSQLLEEWEYHFATPTFQSMKYVMAKNVNSLYPIASNYLTTTPNSSNMNNDDLNYNTNKNINSDEIRKKLRRTSLGTDIDEKNIQKGTLYFDEDNLINVESVKPALTRCGNDMIYEYLQTPNLPFELDYFEVVISLCDVLSLIYTKFQHRDSYVSPIIYDALIKIDSKIKHHVINIIAKELTDLSTRISKEELKTLLR